MKKILVITSVMAITMSLASCGYEAKIETSTAKSDSLQLVINERDGLISETFSDIQEIASSLAQIAEREKIVATTSTGEMNGTAKKQIADNIAAISELLQKNRAAIARLSASTKQLKEANMNIASLDSLVNSLQSQIQSKDAELSQMSANLAKLKVEITELQGLNATLTEQKNSLETTVATQTVDLNAVYWTVNSEKALRERGIVDKKGFIGRTLILNDLANLDDFSKGDLRNIERIPIQKKGVKVVSSHPADSYELVMADKNNVQELVITNKEAFWKTSKILVISYKK